jgi:peptidoglycan-N-acetylglucosamine deacetylase
MKRSLELVVCTTGLALLSLMCLVQAPATQAKRLPPTPTPTPAVTAHGSRSAPQVALTFDACPAVGFDVGIIHTLTETQTPATFFLSGRWAQTHLSATEYLASIPYFEIGEHSWSHPHFNAISIRRMDDEISRTQSLLSKITGRTPALFRFPYGTYSARAVQEIYRLGLTPIQWDVVSGDPVKSRTAPMIERRVLSQTQNGSIIIMHVNGRGWHTAEALPTIIAALRTHGFQFVTVSDLLKALPPDPIETPSPAQ